LTLPVPAATTTAALTTSIFAAKIDVVSAAVVVAGIWSCQIRFFHRIFSNILLCFFIILKRSAVAHLVENEYGRVVD